MNDASQYDYDLPESLIAQQPLENRTDARLMVLHRSSNSIEHLHVRDIGEVLGSNDLLVLNDSRVLPAKLVGRRTDTGGRWQGLFLESDDQGIWRLLGKTRGKIQENEYVTLEDEHGRSHTKLRLIRKLEYGQWAARPETDQDTFELLQAIGRVPLPHYIRDGEMVPEDRERYQTVYAKQLGSVAAPTAGLHFSKRLLGSLREQGVQTATITLHVGIGTFRPISGERLDDHVMHSEWGEISDATVQKIKTARSKGGRIIAVGTTSVRVLETAARDGQIGAWTGQTNLFIRPPFQFHAIDGLMTNFHLPKSTLLVLVRTLGGDELVMRGYREAIEEEYRFFSYGDAMLIL